MLFAATNETRGFVLGDAVRAARTPWSRLVGLLPRAGLAPGEGLWLEPCTSVHTLFMRFPIDVVYVDAGGRVLEVRTLRPFRTGPVRLSARAVLELPEGRAGDTRPGDLIRLAPLLPPSGPG